MLVFLLMILTIDALRSPTHTHSYTKYHQVYQFSFVIYNTSYIYNSISTIYVLSKITIDTI